MIEVINLLISKRNSWMQVLFFLILLLIQSFGSRVKAQEQFPQGYFLFPFNPGKVNFLSGNMGELRSNHFHGGLDVKTAAQIGLPILASADGYVSRIKVASFGYGNVIYITHPNNFVTVYAHLDKFNKDIADFVRKKQYEKQTFEIELLPGETDLVLKKGDIIGISGNTGSSGGPHLHYEIRDKNDKLYNPLMFGFTEIKDNLPPVFEKMVLKTFDLKSRVNNQFGRNEYTCVRQGKTYIVPGNISARGIVGLELKIHDRMNGTHNMYGVTRIEVKMDGRETFSHNLKTLPFEDHKYINAHIDYENYIRKGRRFEKCYISDGNNLSTYSRSKGNGKFRINDTLVHLIQVNIYDALNNVSTLNFKLQGEGAKKTFGGGLLPPKKIPEISSELFENILKIRGLPDTNLKAKLFTKTFAVTLLPEYFENGLGVYLYDLRKGLPDSVVIGKKAKVLSYIALVPSGKEAIFNHARFKISFSKECLFDTLYLQYKNTVDKVGKEFFTVNDASIAFFKPPEVTMAPYIKLADTHQVHVYNVTKFPKFEGGEWKGNSMVFYPKSFGKYSFYKDDINPVIRYINKVGNSARFNIYDRNSGLLSFKATLNGKWLLMNYDHKRNLIWSEPEDNATKLKGELIVEVVDRCGNKTVLKKVFT